MVDPQHDKSLRVVRYEIHGGAAGAGYWEIEEQSKQQQKIINGLVIENTNLKNNMDKLEKKLDYLFDLVGPTATKRIKELESAR